MAGGSFKVDGSGSIQPRSEAWDMRTSLGANSGALLLMKIETSALRPSLLSHDRSLLRARLSLFRARAFPVNRITGKDVHKPLKSNHKLTRKVAKKAKNGRKINSFPVLSLFLARNRESTVPGQAGRR